MTPELESIVNGAIVATQVMLGDGPLATSKVLLVTPDGLLSRECYLDLTNHYHRQPAMAELRTLASETKAHVAVIVVPLLDSAIFYVECKDFAAWQGQAIIQRNPARRLELLPFTFEDGSASYFNPVLTRSGGVPVVSTHAG